MNNILKTIILSFIFLSSIAVAGKFPVNSIEYSVSLKTTNFQHGQHDIDAYQSNLFKYLDSSRVENEEFELDKDLHVSYWDTEDRLLRKQNIIVRHRSKGKKFKITLKYRGDSQEKAENWDLPTAYETKIKTEIDRYIDKDAYSRSITVKIKEKVLTTEILLGIFPNLKDYGLTKQKTLKRVNSFFINSRSYKIAKYSFGKKHTVTSDFNLDLWSCYNGKIIAAEVSWKIKNKDIKDNNALKLSSNILKVLSADEKWADLNSSTKTSIAYDGKDICIR